MSSFAIHFMEYSSVVKYLSATRRNPTNVQTNRRYNAMKKSCTIQKEAAYTQDAKSSKAREHRRKNASKIELLSSGGDIRYWSWEDDTDASCG
mmetsp:Transcript_5656/g.8198  ORF Transcript_5656/g.8198 Transcript_5656/m.8198 type:complete len:93 (+) Transcript_5656:1103-1381(+)